MTENAKIIAAVNGAATIGRWQGLTLFAAVALPIVAAWIIFYSGVGMPANTLNQGELLLPAQRIDELALWGEDGEQLNIASQKPLWRYLILAGDHCAGACEKLLYTSRQVHIRLGEKAARVERLLVTNKPLSALRRGELAMQHPRLKMVRGDSRQIERWLSDTNHAQIAQPSALLVDQEGFAMMVYDNRHSGNQLLRDINRLLKYSYQQ